LNALIQQNQLENIHQARSLLDGKDICMIYEIKPGKALKSIIDE